MLMARGIAASRQFWATRMANMVLSDILQAVGDARQPFAGSSTFYQVKEVHQ